MHAPDMAPLSVDKTVRETARFFGGASALAKGVALCTLITFLGLAGVIWIGKDAWVKIYTNEAALELLTSNERHCQEKLTAVESASKLRDATQSAEIQGLKSRVAELEAKETAQVQ